MIQQLWLIAARPTRNAVNVESLLIIFNSKLDLVTLLRIQDIIEQRRLELQIKWMKRNVLLKYLDKVGRQILNSKILLVKLFQKLSHLPNGVIGQDAADYAAKAIKLEDELVQVDVTMLIQKICWIWEPVTGIVSNFMSWKILRYYGWCRCFHSCYIN